MPPKKAPSGSKSPLGETDLSDLQSLPQLNDFVFTTLYAFKYRISRKKVEEALKQELDLTLQPPSADPEIAEAQKRTRVIQMKDLLENAEARQYLTAQEIAEKSCDATKLQQALARSTNDLLVSI